MSNPRLSRRALKENQSYAAFFVPFDLFGNDGTQRGCHILFNRYENVESVKRYYHSLTTFPKLINWRLDVAKRLEEMMDDPKNDRIAFLGGNHITVMPIYDVIYKRPKLRENWNVVRFDAHADFSRQSRPLYIGNFMSKLNYALPIVHLGCTFKRGIYYIEETYSQIEKRDGRITLETYEFLSGDCLFIDFDVDAISYRDFKSYVSHHKGGLRIKTCEKLIRQIVRRKKWKKILIGITEFSGIEKEAPVDAEKIKKIVEKALE